MQRHFRILPIAAVAVIFLLTSCSKTNKEGRMVPREASFVIHISGKSLSGKISMQEIKQSDWFRQMQEEVKKDSIHADFFNKLADFTQTSGLDSLSDFILFADNSDTKGTKLVMEAGLKDAGTFEAFMKSLHPDGAVSKNGDLQVMTVKDKAVITWNNEKVVAAFPAPDMNRQRNFGNDSLPGSQGDISQLTAYCSHLYTLKEDSSMAREEKFTDMVNTEGDMHAWVNFEKFLNNMPEMGMLSMMKMDKFFDSNISAYTLNFENGKITLKSKGYAGKELNDILKKYSGGALNKDMIRNIPSQDVAVVLAMHFKPEGLQELVKLTGMDGFIDLFLGRNGFTIEDFVKANKGDILFALTDLSIKKDSTSFQIPDGKAETFMHERPDAKFIFAAAINDKEAFNKIINYAKRELGDGAPENIAYNLNKDYFAIGSSPDYVSQYLAGGKTEPAFLSKLGSSPIGVYIDLQKIMKVTSVTDQKDSLQKRIYDESLKVWDNVFINGGDYSSGGMNQTLEINMLDKNTNSLKQLINYAGKMATLEGERDRSFIAVTDTVSTEKHSVVTPVPATAKPKNKTK